MPPLSPDRLKDLYRALAGSRRAEQAITDLAREGALPGHHSGLGHESIGVAIGYAVRPDDCVQMSHRSGMMLSHARGGVSLRDAILGKFGRASPRPADAPVPRTLPVVGLVGTWVPMAVGVAMADRARGRDTVTLTFFGDGAANEGAVHEAMNLAALRRLPMVFVLENNGMAVSLRTRESTAATDLVSRAVGYGMPGALVDGQDPLAIHDVVAAAVARARSGAGPTLIEVRMQRWEPHAHGLPDVRDAREIAEARSVDGLQRLRRQLQDGAVATDAELRAVEDACAAEVAQAVADGVAAGVHDPSPPPYSRDEARRLAYGA